MTCRLTARAIKITVVLDPSLVRAQLRPEQPRTPIEITVDGRKLTASLNPKSVGKALSAINAHGPAGVAVILQGKLGAGDTIEEAGLSAQPKVRQVEAQAAAA